MISYKKFMPLHFSVTTVNKAIKYTSNQTHHCIVVSVGATTFILATGIPMFVYIIVSVFD